MLPFDAKTAAFGGYKEPKIAAPVSFNAPLKTSLDMPIRGHRDAPKTFKGRYTEVMQFIQHYDRLIKKCRVTDEDEKCEYILEYCSINVQNVIKSLESYHRRRWESLRKDILRLYDADRVLQKYKPGDVVTYTLKTKDNMCVNLTQWRKYLVKYQTIAGGPYQRGHLNREGYLTYFWLGIHQNLRMLLETYILQRHPHRDNTPYTIDQVNAAAEWYFRRNKPETIIVNASEYGIQADNDLSGDESNDSDSSDDSDSEYEAYRKRLRDKQRKKKKHSRDKKKIERTPEIKTQKYSGNEDEVASMIRKLNGMKIEDPEYAPMYYKVITSDNTGVAVNCVRAPVGRSRAPTPFRPSTEGSSGNTGAMATPGRPPLTYPNNIPLGDRRVNFAPNPGYPAEQGCFGCGTMGHQIRECPQVKDLVTRNIVHYNPESRRLNMNSGAIIRRLGPETIVQAIERIHTSQTQSQTQAPVNSTTPTQTAPREQGRQYGTVVNAAERATASTRSARREVMDGVYAPTRPGRNSAVPIDEALPKKVKTAPIVPEPKPVDARKVRIQDRPDAIMEDALPASNETQKGVRKKPDGLNDREKKKPEPRIGRQSAISGTVDKRKLAERILDMQLPVTVRELMESSKDVRTEFQDLIRVKNVKAVLLGKTADSIPAFSGFTWPRKEGFLIKVDMQTADSTICAIIDTGSQLNVTRADVAALKIRKPVDMSRTTNMNDANGGSGQLQGWIDSVDLDCGGIHTAADVWLSHNAPFELLLGRPWQRGNLVSIDERDEGTYLVF
ncbi:hypothetical protein FB45DRAFT_737732, partial [Roridomyces roridus]